MLRQFPLTPSAGKRLIARALTQHPAVERVLRDGRVAIVAGTTTGYVAEEILKKIGQSIGFVRKWFHRGLTVSPAAIPSRPSAGGEADAFRGDVVIVKGVWQRAATIFGVAAELDENDLILKGANALDLGAGEAATFVDHPDGGPMAAVWPAVFGRRIPLLIPVGVEKRVPGPLSALTRRLAASDARGPRLALMPGQVFTELDAVTALTGARAELSGAGGVAGAEGCAWLAIEGDATQLDGVERLLREVLLEPAFQ